MFSYYLRLAFKSIRRTPVLSALMVAALGLGIGAFMTTFTVYYLMSGDPIPQKSDVLYAVQLDNWDPLNPPTEGPEDVQEQVTYRDSMALIEADTPATNQVVSYEARVVIQPEGSEEPPFRAAARATYASFFEMFDVPFAAGGPWTRDDDDARRRVAVLNLETAEKLFGDADSAVGQRVRAEGEWFDVVGVIDDWQPVPRFYHVDAGNAFNDTEEIFFPMHVGVEMILQPAGNTNCWKPMEENGLDAFLRSECVWLQFWAQLDTPQQVVAYQEYLDNYVRGQKELGRFERPINNFISPVMAWMDINGVVSNDNRVLVRLSFLFLLVCVLNTVGLLMAKFLGKSGEVALRRAMGASRRDVFTQNLLEIGVIGFLGGLAGLALAALGLLGVEKLYQGYEHIVKLDPAMLATAIGLSILASVLAGLYPVWRTASQPPAGFLKTQ